MGYVYSVHACLGKESDGILVSQGTQPGTLFDVILPVGGSHVPESPCLFRLFLLACKTRRLTPSPEHHSLRSTDPVVQIPGAAEDSAKQLSSSPGKAKAACERMGDAFLPRQGPV